MGGAILVLLLVLDAIGKVTWSVALLTNSRLEMEKKCNGLTDLNCSCADVAWKFRWMSDVNVDMKQYHPVFVAS